jgi:hypothetical protein
MLGKIVPKGSLLLLPRYSAAFKKYDFTDALNFKSQLSEDEHIVLSRVSRSLTLLASSRRRISLRESWKTTVRRSSTDQC